ncbi:MAG: GNAT family N-acetyltransferase [Bifidobacteriaceae bacterium]|nr:GNAT family N-acetyltransferase [Bifidobacteriaceae bacterium]
MTAIFSAPRPLVEAARVGDFDCGVDSLNRWLATRAWRNQVGGASRAYTAAPLGDEFGVAGFYALSAGEARLEGLPGAVRGNMPDPVPVVVLGRLAVDRRWQGAGLGSALLADAVRRAARAASIVGIRAMVVHALPGAEGFYRALGFTEAPPGSGRFLATLQRLAASIAAADQGRHPVGHPARNSPDQRQSSGKP